MFRLFFLTFTGTFRGTEHQKHHLHESPMSMTMPLMVLAILAVVAGFIGIPHGIGESMGIHHWLDHYLQPAVKLSDTHWSATQEWAMIGGTTGAILAAIFAAYISFVKNGKVPVADHEMHGLQKLIYNKYYVDEMYETTITKPLDKVSALTETHLDNKMVDGTVNGVGDFVRSFGNKFRELQTGNLGNYLLAMVLAMVVVLIVSLL